MQGMKCIAKFVFHVSVAADRIVCISLREYISPVCVCVCVCVCGNPKHLLCYGTSVWIFDTSSHKHVIFFSCSSFAPMLCLTVLPFVELDADKWIAALLPRQDVGNMRGERKYINGGHQRILIAVKANNDYHLWQTRE
jgi:hypothetical protein